MTRTNRRDLLWLGSAAIAFPSLTLLNIGCTPRGSESSDDDKTSTDGTRSGKVNSTENSKSESNQEAETGAAMKIQYLEIVSPDADAICATYEQVHGVKFGEPDANLGNARTAEMATGGLLGVRAPLRDSEQPIARPYFLVEDIEAAVAKAKEAGAEIALPPMPLPGHGTCAIFIQGGAEHALWQL